MHEWKMNVIIINVEDENNFEKQVSRANEQQRTNVEDINKKNIYNDNDFFKQLYQNNVDNQSNQPDRKMFHFKFKSKLYGTFE